jgi:hypothetical protein
VEKNNGVKLRKEIYIHNYFQINLFFFISKLPQCAWKITPYTEITQLNNKDFPAVKLNYFLIDFELLITTAYRKIFMTIFEYVEKNFFQNDVFKLQEVLKSEYSLRTDLELSRHFLFYRFQTNQRC